MWSKSDEDPHVESWLVILDSALTQNAPAEPKAQDIEFHACT